VIKSQQIAASIEGFDLSQGAYSPGDSVESTITVENRGNVRHEFYIEYNFVGPYGNEYNNSGTPEATVTIDPGASESTMVSWTVPDGAPRGEYDAVAVVWKNTESRSLNDSLDKSKIDSAVRVERPDDVVIVSYDPETSTYDNRTATQSSVDFDAASASLPSGYNTSEYTPPGTGYRSKRIISTDQYPWSAVGALKFSFGSDSDSFCSATVIEDNHIVTAAHCVYSHETNSWRANQYLTLEFSPGQNHNKHPFGSSQRP
jgi:V8-like Glu-specific endopeptidase